MIKKIQFLNASLNISCCNLILDNLIKMLNPYFKFISPSISTNDKKFTIKINNEEIKSYKSTIIKNGKRVNLHSGEKGYLFISDNKYYYLYENENILTIINQSRDNFIFISSEFNEYTLLEIIKQIRCLLVDQIEKSDFYCRGHAAAIEIDGKIYLLCGPKGSGKTSFLTTAMRNKKLETKFISNDKVIFDHNLNVWGLPYAVSIAPECLRECEEITHTSNRTTISNKNLFWPNTFSDFFSNKIINGGEISGIIFTHLDLNNEQGIEIKTINYQNIQNGILFTDIEKNSPYWLVTSNFVGRKNIRATKPIEYSKVAHYSVSGNPWRFDWVEKLNLLLSNH